MAAEVSRDRWGRPLITPADGGTPVAYTRFSSLGQVLEDRFGLEKWKIRTSGRGLALRQDLFAQVAACPDDDTKRLDGLMEQALEAGGGSVGANMGTALHEFTQRLDLGEITVDDIPEPWRADVQAYVDTIKAHGLTIVTDLIEVTLVNDELQLAGTADRFYRTRQGNLICADLKTGKAIGANPLAYMVQLTAYAHSELYNIDSGQRTPIGDVDLETGLIIHLPAGKAHCDLYEVNLKSSLTAAKLAVSVKEWQKRRDLITKLPAPISIDQAVANVVDGIPGTEPLVTDVRRAWLVDRINNLRANQFAFRDLASLWPSDIPKLSNKEHHHTDAEIDMLVNLIASLEATHEIAFGAIDPNTPVIESNRRQTKIKKATPKPDLDADDAEPSLIEELRTQIGELSAEEKVRLDWMASLCAKAKKSVSLRARPSFRRAMIASAMIVLAQFDEDIIEALINESLMIDNTPDGRTIGNKLGSLTISDAQDLEYLATRLSEGRLGIRYNDDGQVVIVEPSVSNTAD